mmetsp:Transcript_44378/g.95638  ORF Transcript_44378/g.95638 Transcript_44378/m.95638 type:complete len:89 (+) Transcript_44378:1142-1408(+)
MTKKQMTKKPRSKKSNISTQGSTGEDAKGEGRGVIMELESMPKKRGQRLATFIARTSYAALQAEHYPFYLLEYRSRVHPRCLKISGAL